jgi:hypothetical protein
VTETGKQILKLVPTLDERAQGRIFRAILAECDAVMPGKRYKVVVSGYTGAKIVAIKALRAATGFGLAEAKGIIDNLKDGVPVGPNETRAFCTYAFPFGNEVFSSYNEAQEFLNKLYQGGRASREEYNVDFATEITEVK